MRKDAAFIFDFDGTLADSLPAICKALVKTYENFGLVSPGIDEFISRFGATEYGILKSLNPDKGDAMYDEFMRQYALLTDAMAPRPFDGVVEMLGALKKSGTRMALVTGKSLASTYYALGKYNLDTYFDYVGVGGDTGSVKTLRISTAIKRWEISPDNVYYVGDSPMDVDDAKRAGVHAISAAWAGGRFSKEIVGKNPEMIFGDIKTFKLWLAEKFGVNF